MPPDKFVWFRCDGCCYESVEDEGEFCERCSKSFCKDCWKEGGYIDMAGLFWGGGTGYICPKCAPVHAVDTECPNPVDVVVPTMARSAPEMSFCRLDRKKKSVKHNNNKKP